jgi:hypothetical protein
MNMKRILFTILLALTLTDSAQAQKARPTTNQRAVSEAIKTLRALGSAVSVGVSYVDYRRRLADAKVAIDQLLIWANRVGSSGVKSAFSYLLGLGN